MFERSKEKGLKVLFAVLGALTGSFLNILICNAGTVLRSSFLLVRTLPGRKFPRAKSERLISS
jgi:hypothetical protein